MSRVTIFSLLTLFTTNDTLNAATPLRVKDDPSKYKIESFEVNNFKLEGAYHAMTGPTKKKIVKLETSKTAKAIWIKGVKVDVFSPEKKEEPLGLLCHAWITLSDKSVYQSANEGLLTISEGMSESLFPRGFGMKLEGTRSYDIELLAQALNDDPHLKKELGYRFTLTYIEEDSKDLLNLEPLKQITFSAVGKAVKFKNGEMCQAEEGIGEGVGVHFVVPPGRHEFRRAYPRGTFALGERIHFIKVHLHQYGQRIALIDKTAGRILWEGAASYAGDHIKKVDSYSSERGIATDPGHEYEIVGEYFNPTSRNVDGMAVLRLYRNVTKI